MRIFQKKKGYRKNQKHTCYDQQIFSPENRVIMVKNIVHPDRLQVTMQCGAEKMRFVCRITKARILTRSHNM